MLYGNTAYFLKLTVFLLIMEKPYLYNNPSAPDVDTDVLTDTEVEVEKPYSLIVWNDDVNTFDWVIETLIEVCGHSLEQAQQCTLLVHYKGKCAVKKGSYDELKPKCDAITERKIGATIEIS